MSQVNHISITITGPAQSGKTRLINSIIKLLEDNYYCVAIPNRELRDNKKGDLLSEKFNERPRIDNTVISINKITLT